MLFDVRDLAVFQALQRYSFWELALQALIEAVTAEELGVDDTQRDAHLKLVPIQGVLLIIVQGGNFAFLAVAEGARTRLIRVKYFDL